MKKRVKRRVGLASSPLLQKNSFLIGLGSVLNISGAYFDYNYSNSAREADSRALQSDWRNVGKDIRDSIDALSKSSSVCLK